VKKGARFIFPGTTSGTWCEEAGLIMSKLYIVMVGLPARGKSIIAKKLKKGLIDENISSEIFNNGIVRRELYGEFTHDAHFFDPNNREYAEIREKIALFNLQNAKEYLESKGQVAILDATNLAQKRRDVVKENLHDHPILFVNCVNSDRKILELSIYEKTKSTDFSHLESKKAFENFKKRIKYYESMSEPLSQSDHFVTVDTLKNEILSENEHQIPFYALIRELLVSDWIENLLLIRHTETFFNIENRIGGDSDLTPEGIIQAEKLRDCLPLTNPQYIFTSTRRRTIQTADILKQRFPDARIMPLSEFDEIDSGECDSLTYEEIREKKPVLFRSRSEDKYNFKYPNGESYTKLIKRVTLGLKKAIFINKNSPDFVIIGHRAVNRAILSQFQYRQKKEIPHIYMSQDHYFRIISTHKKKCIERINFADS
jgi:broad specificity phosphatase PhoE/predicted kinase